MYVVLTETVSLRVEGLRLSGPPEPDEWQWECDSTARCPCRSGLSARALGLRAASPFARAPVGGESGRAGECKRREGEISRR